MQQSRRYYKDLVCHVVEKYFGVDATACPALGYGDIDIVCELPKDVLRRPNPFPHLGEFNLFYLLPAPANVGPEDIVRSIGALYIASGSQRAQGKSLSLTVLTAGKFDLRAMSKSVHVAVESKEQPWIYRLAADVPAYIFVIDEMPMNKEEYWCFLPFQSRGVLEAYQRRYPRWHAHLKELTQANVVSQEDGVMLFWLKQLHAEFYHKEIGVSLDRQEIAESLCPKVLQKVREQGFQEGMQQGLQKGRNEGMQQGLNHGIAQGMEQGLKKGRDEGSQQAMPKGMEQGVQQGIAQGMQRAVLCLLKKLGPVPDEMSAKLGKVNSLETLEILMHTATSVKSVEEFENQMRVIFWKYRM